MGTVSFTIRTRSILPHQSNLEAVLNAISPGSGFRFAYGPRPNEMTATVPPRWAQDVARLLLLHQWPRVTAITAADLTLALDFYSLPPDRPGGDPGDGFQRTSTGERMNAAKYGGDQEALEALITDAASLAANHPLFRRAKAVMAVPGHLAGPGPVDGLPRRIAQRVARRLQTDDLSDRLQRVRPVSEAKARGEMPQAGTMEVFTGLRGEVLLVDDALGQGHTLAEACRAARQAGAERVYSLVLAKDWTGTRGFRKEDL